MVVNRIADGPGLELEEALAEPHAREMDFTGRALKGFVYVAPAGLAGKRDLRAWVRRGTDYVLALPPK